MAEREDLTQKEAAQRLGISPRHLRRITKSEVVSRNEDGSYPWPQVRDEHRAHLRSVDDERAAGFGDSSYEAARARKTAAQARLAELEVAEREGRLIAIEDMEEMLREPLEKVNVVLKNVPSRQGPALAKAADIPLADAKALLSDAIEAVREELREVPGPAEEADAAA